MCVSHSQMLLNLLRGAFVRCVFKINKPTAEVVYALFTHHQQNFESFLMFNFVNSLRFISQDNVVCLSPRLAQSLGNMGQVCVCVRVTSTIHLIDPNTLQSECPTVDLSSDQTYHIITAKYNNVSVKDLRLSK